MEEKILEILNRKNKALDLEELRYIIELKGPEELQELEETIQKM